MTVGCVRQHLYAYFLGMHWILLDSILPRILLRKEHKNINWFMKNIQTQTFIHSGQVSGVTLQAFHSLVQERETFTRKCWISFFFNILKSKLNYNFEEASSGDLKFWLNWLFRHHQTTYIMCYSKYITKLLC